MKLKPFLAATTLSAFGLLAVNQSFADMENPTGAYIGGNYGYLKIDGEDDFDDDNDILQGVVGYRFLPFVAVEGSYVDFGEYGGDLANASTDGMTLAVKGTFPITDNFEIYAKLGQLWWETDYEILNFGGDTDDKGLFYGGGVALGITPNFYINAEYVVYDTDLDASDVAEDVDDTDFGTDYRQASLGLEFRF